MMGKFYLAILLLLSTFSFSCKREQETLLEVVVKNGTSESVQLNMFLLNPSTDNTDTTFLNISSGDTYIWRNVTRGDISQYPIRLQEGTPPGDSLHVIFQDSLSVTHYFFSVEYILSVIDSSAIEYDESRNIYNPDNYTQEKLDKNYFRGTYIITESDLDYALSIHEQEEEEEDFILPNIYTLSSLETMLKLNLAAGLTQKHITLYFQYYYDYL